MACCPSYNIEEGDPFRVHNPPRHIELLEVEKLAKMPPTKTLRQGTIRETAETNKKAKEEERSDPENTPINRHDYANSQSKTSNNNETVL